jgi:hypothetical protein
MPKIKPSFLFAICAWSLLILRFGYRYGTGDQVELLPYTLFLHDASLYPHDFFIHGLNASVPNERTVMAYLLLPFVSHLEIFCFLFQFLTTIFLILGLERLAAQFIQNKYLVWLAVLTAIIPLNDYALGNVEIYSECLQASGVATALIVWALNWFLEKKYVQASVLISIASFIQLLEGLDVMLVLSAVLFIFAINRQVAQKTFITFIAIFACTSGVYLVWIFLVKSGIQSNCSPLTNAELFDILFKFRHPHHFIFTSFPKFKVLIFSLLSLLGLWWYKGRSITIYRFFLIAIGGLIIYAVVTDVFHFIFLANFQFYKVTQWMKFLGVVALVGLAEQWGLSKYMLKEWKPETAVLCLLCLLSWVAIIGLNSYLPFKVPYQIFGMKEKDDMINICEQIRQQTPPDAVFIQPFDNSELKFYARRSSFVEFKANVRHKCFVGDWYRRIQCVYDISVKDPAMGFALQQKADEHFYNLTLHELAVLQQQGVNYMLVKKDMHPHAGSLILTNNSYAVYKL